MYVPIDVNTFMDSLLTWQRCVFFLFISYSQSLNSRYAAIASFFAYIVVVVVVVVNIVVVVDGVSAFVVVVAALAANPTGV